MKCTVMIVVAGVLAAAAPSQISLYGTSTPPGFTGVYDSGGQFPIVGSPTFGLSLAGHGNAYGGGLIFGFNMASLPVAAATILVDLNGALIVALPPGVTQVPLPIPAFPGFVGYTGFTQAGVFDPGILGGVALTNGMQVTVMPDRTPTRAYLPGQNFAGGPGFMAVLDLSVQPPVFRATGSAGFAGNITNDFPNKIVVADIAQMAYALGNGTANQYVRVFDVTADPAGVVAHVAVGNIPIAGDVTSIVGGRDMEVTSSSQFLFVASGASNVSLEVFDVSNVPSTLPTTAVQTIGFPGAGSGAVGLELSPAEDRLAVVVSNDASSTITIYAITTGIQPLVPIAYVSLGAFAGLYSPSDVHFSADGRLLFVTGSNGFYNVIDTQPTPPVILVGAGTYPNGGANLWCHGSAVGVQNGAPVGIVASEGNGASYYVVDLNETSPSFGAIIANFSTNTAPGSNGNVSNHRMHARQNIVVAIDGTGATADCQWVDVIDLNQPIPGGYQSWRVRMPTASNVAPGFLSSIPRDFDVY